jgi:hypothetical protein
LRQVPGKCDTSIKLLRHLALFHGASLRLCPVFFNGKMILPRQQPDNLASKVTAVLAGASLR